MSDTLQPEDQWLIAWFREKNAGLANNRDLGRANYFAVGLIDSFGVIQLIADIEQHFGVRFDEDDFQKRGFSTVDGLAELIREKSAA
jgi:acyl carrier protein